MKQRRQALILEIIGQRDVDTQEAMLACLREHGVEAAQATISRDIKELHLVKEPAGQGLYRYAPARSDSADDAIRRGAAEKLRGIFRDSVTSIECAQNLVILKTMPGLASAACSALDGMSLPDMLGSLAGDDTAFLAMRSSDAAAALCGLLRDMV